MITRTLVRRVVARSRLSKGFLSSSASYSTRQNSLWVPKLFKKQEWTSEESKSEIWDHTARSLKESLVRKDGQYGNVKEILMRLIEDSPDNLIPVQYIPMVEMANSLVKLSLDESDKLFKALAGNDPKLITQCSTIIKLFSTLLKERPDFENSVLFMRFLRAQGKYDESLKLLEICIPKANDDDISKCLQLFAPYNDLLDDEFLKLLLSKRTIRSTTWNEAIMVKADMVMAKGEGSISDLIPLNKVQHSATVKTVIVLLDSCLTLNDNETGKAVLEQIVQKRFDKLRIKDPEAAMQFYELLLSSLAVFDGDYEFGQKMYKLIQDFPETEYVKETWDVLAQWIASKGTLEELQTLITRMNELGDQHFYHADEATLTGVIKAAGNRDGEFVKSIMQWFKTIHIDTNVDCFAVLIHRCLNNNDHDQAAKLFQKSLNEGCNWKDHDSGIKELNKLLVAMAPEADVLDTFQTFKKIKMFVDTVGYEAQAAILKMFLDHGCVGDAGMFLQDEFGAGKAESTASIPAWKVPDIYKNVMEFIMKCEDYNDSWYIYGMMCRFIVLPADSYFPVMKRFCYLQRPDAALKIFRSMRTRYQKHGECPPTKEMYIMLFNEFGRTLYEEGVLELHLYFKMDLANEAEMPIMNSIMGAYCDLQDHDKVVDMWTQVSSFPKGKGVDNDTVTIMIKHLTRESIQQVEQFWLTMGNQYGLAPTLDNLRQYLVANCYHGYYMRALHIARDMNETYGLSPDKETIKQLYNWTMVSNRKEQVKEWAIENYPDTWVALQQSGELKEYLLPENDDGSSDEMRRGQVAGQLEGEVVAKNEYIPELPEKR